MKFANLTFEICSNIFCAYVDINNDVVCLVNMRLKLKVKKADQPRFVFDLLH